MADYQIRSIRHWSAKNPGLIGIAIFVLVSVGLKIKSCNNDTAATRSVNALFQQPNSSQTTTTDLAYCRAIVAAENQYTLVGERDVNRASQKCEDLFYALQSIPVKGVDQRFVDWTGHYSDLLLDMKATFARYAARASSDYQAQLMIEALMRGYEGDPFGTALEEGQRNDADIAEMRALIDRRLRLHAELARLYNAIAPPGQEMSLTR